MTDDNTAPALDGLARELEALRHRLDELAALPRRVDDLAHLFATLADTKADGRSTGKVAQRRTAHACPDRAHCGRGAGDRRLVGDRSRPGRARSERRATRCRAAPLPARRSPMTPIDTRARRTTWAAGLVVAAGAGVATAH